MKKPLTLIERSRNQLITLSLTTLLFIGCFEKKNPVEPTEPKVTSTVIFQKDTLIGVRDIKTLDSYVGKDTLGYFNISQYDSIQYTGHLISNNFYKFSLQLSIVPYTIEKNYSVTMLIGNTKNFPVQIDTSFNVTLGLKSLTPNLSGLVSNPNGLEYANNVLGITAIECDTIQNQNYYIYNLKLVGYKTE